MDVNLQLSALPPTQSLVRYYCLSCAITEYTLKQCARGTRCINPITGCVESMELVFALGRLVEREKFGMARNMCMCMLSQ